MEYYTLTAVQLQKQLQEGSLTAEDLTRYYLGRIEAYDQARNLNSVACLCPDAISQAQALDALSPAEKEALPLFGLPILIKDNIDVAGLPTTAGSPVLEDNLALKDAPIVALLRSLGAVILGKTHLTEFANFISDHMPNGFSSGGGQVRNAYDPEMDPSGSSTGSGVAMSAGFCAAAIGTDTCFSIVYCALKNGITGLKPSHGTLSTEGIIPVSHSLDSPGPMTRTLEDALLVYGALIGEDLTALAPTAPSDLRIAVNTFEQEWPGEAFVQGLGQMLLNLELSGAKVGTVCRPAVPEIYEIMRCELKHDLEEYLSTASAKVKTLAEIVDFYEEHPEHMPYGIAHFTGALQASGQLDDPEYQKALDLQKELLAQVTEELAPYDACIMTGPSDIMHFLALPSLTLRLGMAPDGTPLGVILYGTDEKRLLKAALTVERFCAPVTLPF